MTEYSINGIEKILDEVVIAFSVIRSIEHDGKIKQAVVNETFKTSEELSDDLIKNHNDLIDWLKTKINLADIQDKLEPMLYSLMNEDPISSNKR